MNKQIKEWKPTNLFYLEEIDKNLTYHLYCRYLEHTEEIYRETITGKCTYKYYKFMFSCMGGWHPVRKIWFSRKADDNQWYDYCFAHRPGVGITRSFINKNQLIKALPQLKYVYPDYEDRWRFYDFIKMLRKYPEMELIYKNERLKHLWDNRQLYKLSKAKKKQLLRYVATCRRTWCSKLNEFLYCARVEPKDRTKAKYRAYLSLNKIKKIKGIDAKYVVKRYAKQINKLGDKEFVMLYTDYLEMAKKLKVNNLYPRDIKKAHDHLQNSITIKENKKPLLTKKKYAKFVNKIIKHKEIELIIPNSTGELIVLGNKLDNCVGTNGYDQDVREGRSLIIEVRHAKQPVECCEIDLKKMKIEQLYGKSNSSDGKYHFIAQRLINRYIKEIRA